MKKFLTILSLLSVLMTATSCTRGGNADKGDDGHIGDHEKETTVTTDRAGDVTITDTTDNNRRNEKRITGTYDEHEGEIRNLPSRIRRGVEKGVDDLIPDRAVSDIRRDIK